MSVSRERLGETAGRNKTEDIFLSLSFSDEFLFVAQGVARADAEVKVGAGRPRTRPGSKSGGNEKIWENILQNFKFPFTPVKKKKPGRQAGLGGAANKEGDMVQKCFGLACGLEVTDMVSQGSEMTVKQISSNASQT